MINAASVGLHMGDGQCVLGFMILLSRSYPGRRGGLLVEEGGEERGLRSGGSSGGAQHRRLVARLAVRTQHRHLHTLGIDDGQHVSQDGLALPGPMRPIGQACVAHLDGRAGLLHLPAQALGGELLRQLREEEGATTRSTGVRLYLKRRVKRPP